MANPISRSPSAAVKDFNQDGKPDLVLVNGNSGTVSIVLSNGGLSSQPRVNFSVGGEPRCVAAADLNRDGRPDLAVATERPNVAVLKNTTK